MTDFITKKLKDLTDTHTPIFEELAKLIEDGEIEIKYNRKMYIIPHDQKEFDRISLTIEDFLLDESFFNEYLENRWNVESVSVCEERNEKNEWIFVVEDERISSFGWKKNKGDCSICHTSIITNDFKTDCNHTFHRKCLKEWLKGKTPDKKTCPNCRTLITNFH